MDSLANQAKELLDLVATPSALIAGTLLAFASRTIKENQAKVDRTKMTFGLLGSLAAMGLAGSLLGLMAPLAWRSLPTKTGGLNATLVVYWMIFLSIAGSLIYAALITKRCIGELRRPSR